ncbi:unnamed protein product, partial [Brassica oleracea]
SKDRSEARTRNKNGLDYESKRRLRRLELPGRGRTERHKK